MSELNTCELPSGQRIDLALWHKVRGRLLTALEDALPTLTDGLLRDATDAALEGMVEHAFDPGFKEPYAKWYAGQVIATLKRPEAREGMVTVYDSDGEYVGCMGTETWANALAREALITERLAAKEVCDDYEDRGEWENVPAEVIQRALDADKALLASFGKPAGPTIRQAKA